MVAGVLVVERPLREARDQVPTTELFQFGPEEIQSLRLRIQKQPEISLEREGAQWKLIRPAIYPADNQLVHSFVTQLLSMRWEAKILPGEQQSGTNSSAQYGLESPHASIVLGTSNRTQQILVGSATAFGDQCFLKIVGQGPVYVVNAELFRSYPGSPTAWRERRLLTELPAHDRVRIRITDTAFELHQDATNKQWRFSRPFEGRVELHALTNATASLTQHAALQFIDVPEARLSQFGINAEKPVGEITLLKGTNELFQITFGGSPTNSPTNVFAKISGRSGLVLLPESVVQPWKSPKANFRDYHLVSLDPETVMRATFENTNQFTVQRSGINWVMTNASFKLDSLLVSQIIYHLRNTVVEEERAVVTDLSAYMLDKPALKVNLETKEGRNVLLSFAPTTTNKVFVHHSGEAALYSIGSKQFSRLPYAPWQLRDRQIWSFSPPEVLSIEIEQDSRKASFVRNPKTGWSLGTNTQGMINTFWLEETLTQLSILRAVFWVDQGTSSLSQFGLEPPKHKLRLEFDTSRKPLEMWFGNPSEYGHRYAATQLDGQWYVFEIPSSTYNEFIVPNLTVDRLMKKF